MNKFDIDLRPETYLNILNNNYAKINNLKIKQDEKFQILQDSSDLFLKVYGKIDQKIKSSKLPQIYALLVWIQEHNPASKIYKIRKVYQSILNASEQKEALKDFCKRVSFNSKKDFLKNISYLHSEKGKDYLSSIETLSYNSSYITEVPLLAFTLSSLRVIDLSSAKDPEKVFEIAKKNLDKLETCKISHKTYQKANDEWIETFVKPPKKPETYLTVEM